jgi:hypothetical protein
METLHGAAIAHRIRGLSDDAKRSVSVVSPYIGRWPAVAAILGGNWWLGSPLVCRVITDLSTPSNVIRGTLKRLMNRGLVRSLPGVHAKIYIFDQQAVVTSANLTETAFTKRREIGIHLNHLEAEETIRRFESWWSLSGQDLTEDSLPPLTSSETEFAQEFECLNLKQLWPLPDKPDDRLFADTDEKAHYKFRSFQQFVSLYNELAISYQRLGRMWDGPLFLEVDSFLNYLFHEAPGQPSLKYSDNNVPRKLSSSEREMELQRHVADYKKWASTREDERWREAYSKLVQERIAKTTIGSLSIEEAKEVVDCLNCMNARQLNKHKFLQPHNNDIRAIRAAWRNLLFGEGSVEKRMQECDHALMFFGPSSVQELLGWFYPNEMPIRNNNSDAGLRFFGFRV